MNERSTSSGEKFPEQPKSRLDDVTRFLPGYKVVDPQFNLYQDSLASQPAVDVILDCEGAEIIGAPECHGSVGDTTRLLFVEGDRAREDGAIKANIGIHALPVSFPLDMGIGRDVSAYVLSRGARRLERTLINSPYPEKYTNILLDRAVDLSKTVSNLLKREITIAEIGSYANGTDGAADDVDFFIIPTTPQQIRI